MTRGTSSTLSAGLQRGEGRKHPIRVCWKTYIINTINRIEFDIYIWTAREMHNIRQKPCILDLTSSGPAGFGALHLVWNLSISLQIFRCSAPFIYWIYRGQIKPQGGAIFGYFLCLHDSVWQASNDFRSRFAGLSLRLSFKLLNLLFIHWKT